MEPIRLFESFVFDGSKPALRTLLPGPGPRVMLLCLRTGQTLPEHTAPDAITVQALSGRTTFYDGPEPVEMRAGTLIRLEAKRPHALTAHEDSVLLVTIFARTELQDPSITNPVLDLRSIPRGQRHPLVFARLAEMPSGESFTLVNDHDPVPLRRQLESQFINQIAWDYVERGPEVFRVRITRVGLPATQAKKAGLPEVLVE